MDHGSDTGCQWTFDSRVVGEGIGSVKLTQPQQALHDHVNLIFGPLGARYGDEGFILAQIIQQHWPAETPVFVRKDGSQHPPSEVIREAQDEVSKWDDNPVFDAECHICRIKRILGMA